MTLFSFFPTNPIASETCFCYSITPGFLYHANLAVSSNKPLLHMFSQHLRQDLSHSSYLINFSSNRIDTVFKNL